MNTSSEGGNGRMFEDERPAAITSDGVWRCSFVVEVRRFVPTGKLTCNSGATGGKRGERRHKASLGNIPATGQER
jgi:hypothetical protein